MAIILIIWAGFTDSPSKTPQKTATMGIKYVQLLAKTAPDFFISTLYNMTDKAVPTTAKILMYPNEDHALGCWAKCELKSEKPRR